MAVLLLDVGTAQPFSGFAGTEVDGGGSGGSTVVADCADDIDEIQKMSM